MSTLLAAQRKNSLAILSIVLMRLVAKKFCESRTRCKRNATRRLTSIVNQCLPLQSVHQSWGQVAATFWRQASCDKWGTPYSCGMCMEWKKEWAEVHKIMCRLNCSLPKTIHPHTQFELLNVLSVHVHVHVVTYAEIHAMFNTHVGWHFLLIKHGLVLTHKTTVACT